MFLCIASVSASDVNETDSALTTDADEQIVSADSENVLENSNVENNDAVLADNGTEGDGGDDNATAHIVSASAKVSSANVFVKNQKFDIQILDENKKGIAGKQVQVKFNNKVSNVTTDSNGHAYYKLTGKGTYKISYTFNQEGYTKVTGSKSITIVDSSKSKITGPAKYNAYVGAKNTYRITLTTGGVKMANKQVTIKFKGKTYKKTTNSKGQVTLGITTSKTGTYAIKYSFKGETNAKAASGSGKVIVKKGMPTKVVRMNSITYKHQVKAPLKFLYKDARGKPISAKTIVLEIGGKSYTKKTGNDGTVTFYIKKNAGTYRVHAYSYNTKVLKSSSATFNIKVKSEGLKYNGFWLFGSDMKSVNLNDMAKKGVNQIFLNEYAVTLYGKSGVSDFALKAKALGINVHIWMMTFNDGDWISPVTSSGKYKYSLFNSIIKDAKDYASIKGVAGIHFDYIRFPGTAYKHTNGADAITYFTKTACEALHKQNPSLIVSAAVMAEPGAMTYYYGQDISEMSKHLDWIIPMVYKGNYNQNSAWIKSVTSYFVKQSNGAKILTGLQGYYSDDYVKKLPTSQLINDAHNAANGGASGVVVFRYSLFNMINFKNL